MTDGLRELLAAAGPVLLDFDGPVTHLLPAGPNAEVAAAARVPIERAGLDIPEQIASSTDHVAVLHFAAGLPSSIARSVDDACRAGEMRAAQVSVPTQGSAEFLHACRSAGRVVVIASNNDAEAIEAYLVRQGLADHVAGIVGRVPGRPDLMKPNPTILRKAVEAAGRAPAECVMVGDSLTDVQASRAAGVPVIGYAKTPARGEALARAGADAVTDSMHALAAAIDALPRSQRR